jgi:hypothetical protein
MKKKIFKKRSLKEKELLCIVWGVTIIGGLETVALMKGVDGTMFSTATAGIGVIMGYLIKGIFKR